MSAEDKRKSVETKRITEYAQKVDDLLKDMVHTLFTEQPADPLEVTADSKMNAFHHCPSPGQTRVSPATTSFSATLSVPFHPRIAHSLFIVLV